MWTNFFVGKNKRIFFYDKFKNHIFILIVNFKDICEKKKSYTYSFRLAVLGCQLLLSVYILHIYCALLVCSQHYIIHINMSNFLTAVA
jgi:hypothetical protein